LQTYYVFCCFHGTLQKALPANDLRRFREQPLQIEVLTAHTLKHGCFFCFACETPAYRLKPSRRGFPNSKEKTMLKSIIFRLRYHYAMWRFQRKFGKFGPVEF
jgi:hypothetical protein